MATSSDAPRGALIPWTSLRVYRAERPVYGVHARRALTLWRAGAAAQVYESLGRDEERWVPSPSAVDWSGWVDEPGRRGGAGTPRSARTGEHLPEMAVPRGTVAILEGLVARSPGETKGEIVARALRAEAERVGE